MLGPSYRIAQEIAKFLRIEAPVVWRIIKNVKTTNVKKLIDIVRKALRI